MATRRGKSRAGALPDLTGHPNQKVTGPVTTGQPEATGRRTRATQKNIIVEHDYNDQRSSRTPSLAPERNAKKKRQEEIRLLEAEFAQKLAALGAELTDDHAEPTESSSEEEGLPELRGIEEPSSGSELDGLDGEPRQADNEPGQADNEPGRAVVAGTQRAPQDSQPQLALSTTAKRPVAVIGEDRDVLPQHAKRIKSHRYQTAGSATASNSRDSSSTPKRASGIPYEGSDPTLLKSYTPQTREVLLRAKVDYKMRLSLEHAMPHAGMDREFARLALEVANDKTGSSLVLTPGMRQVLTSTGSSWRGDTRITIEDTVKAQYGLANLSAGDMKARVEFLRSECTYLYKRALADGSVVKRRLPFEHPCIEEVIFKVWFGNVDSLALLHPEGFNPIPFEILAFTCTMVRCCIDQYETGTKVLVPFACVKYRAIYEDHMRLLLDFQTNHRRKCVAMQEGLTRQIKLRVELGDDLTTSPPVALAFDTDSESE